jgi:hypothetical protein
VQSKEQRLCTDALSSHEYDGTTDEQWVAMCEKVAQNSRDTDDAPSQGKE